MKAAPGPEIGAAEVCTLVDKPSASRQPRRRILVLFILLLIPPAHAIDLSRAESLRIGKKIWQNECAGTVAGLTSWNAGENFASLGIGHFIWYPKGVRGPFEESFPGLADFAGSRGAKLPQVILSNRNSGCPWSSRAEFQAAASTPQMNELRRFLADTVDIQADFLVQRLQKALPKMLAEASASERGKLERQFGRVANSAQGCYALVDYVNFKGEGLLDSERYHGQGWGLFQVLEGMDENEIGGRAAKEFASSAARILKRRVENSPSERKESRWLAGWLQRVDSYAN